MKKEKESLSVKSSHLSNEFNAFAIYVDFDKVGCSLVDTQGDTISDDDDPDFNVDDEYESVEDDGSDEQHIPNSSDVDTDVEGEFDSLVVRNVTNLPVGGVPSG
ncbi:hypothetical protein RJT34_12690 [Clitoria ternatea]|uniref:Uncharacterized protein n=1 Tax=Clitoria ternatea TaxID=43366 RepID=A0AAN9JPA4_CLITE